VHPVILQALAAEQVKGIRAAADAAQRARHARRARPRWNRGLIRARPAVRHAAV
jgi:hypothetical protein